MLRVNQKEITTIHAPIKIGVSDDGKPIFLAKNVNAVYRYGKLI